MQGFELIKEGKDLTSRGINAQALGAAPWDVPKGNPSQGEAVQRLTGEGPPSRRGGGHRNSGGRASERGSGVRVSKAGPLALQAPAGSSSLGSCGHEALS